MILHLHTLLDYVIGTHASKWNSGWHSVFWHIIVGYFDPLDVINGVFGLVCFSGAGAAHFLSFHWLICL